MNKAVVYTQRVEVVESYNERRDCADQNIPVFLEACGYLPIPVPNVLSSLADFVEYVDPVGIMLTGGNSLVKYGGGAPERDKTDLELLEIALNNDIPVYGFCRGMQSILDYFGCKLCNVEGHVAVRHQIQGVWGDIEVNSYHNQACKEVIEPLKVMAMTKDGVIEAIMSSKPRLMASMWHPEREGNYTVADIRRLRDFFG